MTSFRIEKFPFLQDEVTIWADSDPKHINWPSVYVLNGQKSVYVGESLNTKMRMLQHLENPEKQNLNAVRVILNDTFNKSVCLDLESYLIRLFSGDGQFEVLNKNAGITDANYYDREKYRKNFEEIFELLKTNENLFTRTIPEIINSDLFKLSPFKSLNEDQAVAVEDILEGLFDALEKGDSSTVVVQGNPGTGKTVVAIYLMKLLEDIRNHDPEKGFDEESIFADFFTKGHIDLLDGLNIGIVVPQQSLRLSISKVFKVTPGLKQSSVMSAFELGKSKDNFDILFVDEAHRLQQRANQSSAALNKQFKDINQNLFGADENKYTQLDWIKAKARHVILMLDSDQSVKPADLPAVLTSAIVQEARNEHNFYPLRSQMRLKATEEYVGYVKSVLSDNPSESLIDFSGYDIQFFDSFSEMREQILKRNQENGLARLVAGFAWKWITKGKQKKELFDIEIAGIKLKWNQTDKDWINSSGSEYEVGSIHTVQGYDLNYAGVIIGNDLRFDTDENRIVFSRNDYHDAKGKENNAKLGISYTDEQLLQYVKNIYAVLLTRGILGTYIYVCDDALRERLRGYFPQANAIT